MTQPSLGFSNEQANGEPAAEFSSYIDANITNGNTKGEGWLAARRVASVCIHLGMQDAARKRRSASQIPGAWAGALIGTDGNDVYVTISEEKWKKSRGMVDELSRAISENNGMLDRKDLERKRGLLLYVCWTYPPMMPYLKGIHLTLDGWHRGRDDHGWKFTAGLVRKAQEAGEYIDEEADREAPSLVKAKSCLHGDLTALKALFEDTTPPKRFVRGKC